MPCSIVMPADAAALGRNRRRVSAARVLTAIGPPPSNRRGGWRRCLTALQQADDRYMTLFDEAAMRMLLLTVAALAACALGAVLIGARQQVYARLARLGGNDRDMGPIDFATLRRRSSPNDALVCPSDRCPFARPDHEAKIYDMP